MKIRNEVYDNLNKAISHLSIFISLHSHIENGCQYYLHDLKIQLIKMQSFISAVDENPFIEDDEFFKLLKKKMH